MMDLDDDGDDEAGALIPDLLPFTLTERELIAQLGSTVRLRMVSTEPETIRKIASFLYALDRLPYTTPDIFLDLAIMNRVGQNLSYVSVELDGQSFRLSSGGYVYSTGVGGDSYSQATFEIEAGGFREGSTEDFSEWLDVFVSSGGVIEIQGDDDDADLTEPAPDDGWQRLAKYWELCGGDVDGW